VTTHERTPTEDFELLDATARALGWSQLYRAGHLIVWDEYGREIVNLWAADNWLAAACAVEDLRLEDGSLGDGGEG